jgi:Kef-type K+ transport system membrane component KefB
MLSLTSAALVAAVAVLVPVAARLCRVTVPESVLEIVIGIVVGPQVLGWARTDPAVQVLSIIGLGFVLLLAGLDIDLGRLPRRLLAVTVTGWAASFILALGVGFAPAAVGLARSPVFVAVVLSATSLGILLPVLADAGEADSDFGQLIVTGASVAELAPIVLLSLLFSESEHDVGSRAAMLVLFVVFALAALVALLGIERWKRLSQTLRELQETTSQIRVRAAFALLVAYAAIAARFGLEVILGAFLAGATVRAVDHDPVGTHHLFRVKLEGAGYGVFVPFFFVSTGMALDVHALVSSPATVAKVPLFLGGLVLARGLPAMVLRPWASHLTQVVAAGLLHATSLSIPVVAGLLGVHLGLIPPENYAALVAAGLVSVTVFPVVSLRLLRRGQP